MQKIITTFFMIIAAVLLSSPAIAAFSVSHTCFAAYCIAGSGMRWTFNITNTDPAPIRIAEINIRDSKGVSVGRYANVTEVQFSETKVIIFEGKVPSPDNVTIAHYRSCFTFYEVKDGKMITTNENCYDVMNMTVLPGTIIRCTRDSECPLLMECEQAMCFPVKCGDCEFADNHSCKRYECCADEECGISEKCLNNTCSQIICGSNEKRIGKGCVALECSFFQKAKNNACERDSSKYAQVFMGILIYLVLAVSVILVTATKGRKTPLQKIIENKIVKKHKEREANEIKEANIHRQLIKYLKNKEEIAHHIEIARVHEKAAREERNMWEAILNVKTCKECGAVVSKETRICPKCGEKLKK